MSSLIIPSSTKPGGGGAVSITTAGARRVVYYDAAGAALKAEAGFEYDETIDVLSVGGTPSLGGGLATKMAVGSTGAGENNLICFWANNNNVLGQGGFFATSNSGPSVRIASCSSGAGATLFGISTGGKARMSADGQILFGTTGANDIVIGTNDVERMRVLGDGSGLRSSRGIAGTPITVADAAYAINAGEGHVAWATTLTAPRAANLPTLASVPEGFPVEIHSVNAVNGANTLTPTPNGDDLINGAGSMAAITTAYGAACLRKASATTWQIKWRTA